MIFIAHRGNLNGPDARLENTIDHIEVALSRNFFVEIDIIHWDGCNIFSLGHDERQEDVSVDWLREHNDKLIAHAKNFISLSGLLKHNIHCFYHTDEDYVLTSRNIIWCYPGVKQSNNDNCIVVKPEHHPTQPWRNAYGICSDYANDYLNEAEV